MLFLEKQGATMHEQGGREVFFFLFFICILFCLCKRLLRLSCELVHLETIAWVQARCLFWVPLQAGVAWSQVYPLVSGSQNLALSSGRAKSRNSTTTKRKNDLKIYFSPHILSSFSSGYQFPVMTWKAIKRLEKIYAKIHPTVRPTDGRC